ncbi:chorismate mutase [Sulfolobus acidocaldarius SUSAZ]|nr:chorismate mutase [Sulfolobus acidocaldarius SUSAZ]
MNELEELRKEIEEIDSQILSLIAKRLQVSSMIGEVKGRMGFNVTDEKREEYVKEYWTEKGRRLGIPESLVSSVLTNLVSYSKMFQVKDSKKRRVTIIGYGGMARSLSSLFHLSGHNVVITGRDKRKAERLANEFKFVYMEEKSALDWSEYVILSISPSGLDYAESVLRYAKEKVVMDIFSTKSNTFRTLQTLSEQFSFEYISTHPLFGPILYPVGERIAVIPSQKSTRTQEVIEFWRKCGLVPVLTTPEEHDKVMAIVQVLAHFYMLGLLRSSNTLKKELEVGNKIDELQTTNFREIGKILDRINSLLPVILEIQKDNPYAHKVRDLGMRELQDVLKSLGE